MGHGKTGLLITCWALLAICGCADTALEDHAPASAQEASIIELLTRYQSARQHFDLERYLGCLHDQGLFHHAGRVMLSKAGLAELLPRFWQQLHSGKRLFFPMCRESLNGNYFVGFRLFNPVIVISNHTASATVTYIHRGWRLKHYITMVKDRGRWRISGLDWETG